MNNYYKVDHNRLTIISSFFFKLLWAYLEFAQLKIAEFFLKT